MTYGDFHRKVADAFEKPVEGASNWLNELRRVMAEVARDSAPPEEFDREMELGRSSSPSM